jgi:hypothetical protein
MGFLIHAAVLAKAQRCKGRTGETPTTMAPFNSQKPLACPWSELLADVRLGLNYYTPEMRRIKFLPLS